MKNYWLKRKRGREVACWNFDTALGETIREKYEHLYVRVVDVSNIVFRRTVNPSDEWPK